MNSTSKRVIELLAPAKDFKHGEAAILCGADAVYVGAPSFGARTTAAVSIEEIGQLCDLAHLYGAKVYVAMNTLIYDDEIDKARELAWEIYDAGADALIVQDYAFVAMDNMPPIALHSSTQMCNRTAEQVDFLARSGFSRVILERAMSIDEIAQISKKVDVELEAFIHGAICVSYSGRCYMSLSMGGSRSGNRGNCMQSCRMPYDLLDSSLRPIEGYRGRHLLSLSDMNRSEELRAMIDAGISSFKIEGRLKDIAYVKNIVSHYRLLLDKIIDSDESLIRASYGDSSIDFTPDPAKSFSRGAINYFSYGNREKMATFDSPKSLGVFVGEVSEVAADCIVLDSISEGLESGDGICFFDSENILRGTNINGVKGRCIYPNRIEGLRRGISVYKNYDHRFVHSLERTTPHRMIQAEAQFGFDDKSLSLKLSCIGIDAEVCVDNDFVIANNRELAYNNISRQITKSADGFCNIISVEIPSGDLPFVSASTLNSLRRETVEQLRRTLLESYSRPSKAVADPKACYPQTTIDSENSVVNSIARSLLKSRGVQSIAQPAEQYRSGCKMMSCRYCLRYELGACLKSSLQMYNGDIPRGDLYIRTTRHTYRLEFDCKKCEMNIYEYGK